MSHRGACTLARPPLIVAGAMPHSTTCFRFTGDVEAYKADVTAVATAVEAFAAAAASASAGGSGAGTKRAPASLPFFMLQEWNPSTYGVAIDVIAELFDALPAFQSYKVEVANAGKKCEHTLPPLAAR